MLKLKFDRLTIFMFAFSLLNLIIAYQNEENPCQQGTRGGLDLSSWMKVLGFINLYINIVCMALMQSDVEYAGILGVAHILFSMFWGTWGTVILFTRQNSSCLTTTLGVTSAVDLAVILAYLIFVAI